MLTLDSIRPSEAFLANERTMRYSFVTKFLTKRSFRDADANETEQPHWGLRS